MASTEASSQHDRIMHDWTHGRLTREFAIYCLLCIAIEIAEENISPSIVFVKDDLGLGGRVH